MADGITFEEATAPASEVEPKKPPKPPRTGITFEEASAGRQEMVDVPQMLKPPMPGFGERAAANAGEAFRGTIVGSAIERGRSGEIAKEAAPAMLRAAEEAKAAGSDVALERFADGTVSPYAGMPVAALADVGKRTAIAARNLEQEHNLREATRRAHFEAMPPWYEEEGVVNKALGFVAATGGALAGGAASPESWIGGVGNMPARRAGETIIQYAARRAGKGALQQASVNATMDTFQQVEEMHRGERQDFSMGELAGSTLFGAGLGAALGAGGALFSRDPAAAEARAKAAFQEIMTSSGMRELTKTGTMKEAQQALRGPEREVVAEGLAPTQQGLALGAAAKAHTPTEGVGMEPAASRSGTITRTQARQRKIAGKATVAAANRGEFDEKQGINRIFDSARQILAPAGRGPWAQAISDTIRHWNALLARATDEAMADLREFSKLVDVMDAPTRRQFMNAMEDPTVPFPSPEMQAMGDQLRHMLEDIAGKLTRHGLLEKARENYFPHYWKDPARAARQLHDLEEEWRKQQQRSPIRGRGSFLLRRTFDVIEAGRNAGLELITDNPLELVALKLREEYRYLFMNNLMEEMKDRGLAVFYKHGARIPHGMIRLNDVGFQVWLPPAAVEHFRSFDHSLMEGLKRVVQKIGAPVHILERIRRDDPEFAKEAGLRGYAMHPQAPPGSRVPAGRTASRFGNTIEVLMHEIGHQLDWKFGISGFMSADPLVWRELRDLAMLRLKPGTTPSLQYARYLLKPEERIANLFHAYWHAPEVLMDYAPHAKARLEVLADRAPELKEILGMVKPGMHIESDTRVERIPGRRLQGQYYAPEPVARVFNNFATPSGLQGIALFDIVRKLNNQWNLWQLGISGFHALFEANDASISKLALAIDQAVKGEAAGAARSAGTSLKGVVPFGHVRETLRKGSALMEAALKPGNAAPEMRMIVSALMAGGGRIGMDPFWRGIDSGSRVGHGVGGFWQAIKQGRLRNEVAGMFEDKGLGGGALAVGKVVARVVETQTDVIMAEYVPRMKLGVFYDAAEDWLRRNPNADVLTLRREMGKLWDAVEDRMGLMTYDNVFWKRGLKDISFLIFRAVGWNLGTIRAIGGGAADFGVNAFRLMTGDARAEWTRRMSYAPALFVMAAIQGSILGYMMTGQWPTTLLDAYFPKTGRKTPYGTPERLSIPGYIKDVINVSREVGEHGIPWQTVINKLNPAWTTMFQLSENRDYYGGLIHDPQDSLLEQFSDVGKWLAEQFLPFSIRGAKRVFNEGDSDYFTSFMSLMGLQPAPASITAPERQITYQQRQERLARRRRSREVQKGLRMEWPF